MRHPQHCINTSDLFGFGSRALVRAMRLFCAAILAAVAPAVTGLYATGRTTTYVTPFAGKNPPPGDPRAGGVPGELSQSLRRPRQESSRLAARPSQGIFGRVVQTLLPGTDPDDPVAIEELEPGLSSAERRAQSRDHLVDRIL